MQHIYSPWPFCLSLSVLISAIGGIFYMKNGQYFLFTMGFFGLLFCIIGWLYDLNREKTQKEFLKIGFYMFLITEIILFATIFAAIFYIRFHAKFDDTIWPFVKNKIDPFKIPYLNTLILILSGCCIGFSEHYVKNNLNFKKPLIVAISLGIIFLILQTIEYSHIIFGLSDGIYPSLFYISTGLHGVHVFLGVLFLAICFFKKTSHNIFFMAAVYWHFVDIVWVILFLSVYF